MTASIEIIDRDRTRQLILDAKGGVMSQEESKTLEQYLQFSQRLFVGSIDGRVCCAWGLVPPSLMSDRAYLWLFHTELIEKHKFIFVRRSQIAVAEMLEDYPIITGFCKIGEDRSIRWLRWLGAVFREPTNPGFIPFEIRKK